MASPQDAMRRGKWWEMFNDPELNALEEQIDANNQSIAQAYENYMAARALVREARAAAVPDGHDVPNVSRVPPPRRRWAPARWRCSGGGSSGQASNFYSLPGDVSWEPDLWGRIRNTINQNRYAAQVSAADLENVRLSQHSTLAQLFFQLRGQDALQQVLDETGRCRQEGGRLRARAVRNGNWRQDLARRSAERAADGRSDSHRPRPRARPVRARDRRPARQAARASSRSPRKPLDAVPPTVPPGIPSELLERRPDIAAAERLMAEANAQIGIAYAAYYPNVTLSASAGFESTSFLQWLSWPSHFWSIGASAAQTIFDAGLRRATVQQFTAHVQRRRRVVPTDRVDRISAGRGLPRGRTDPRRADREAAGRRSIPPENSFALPTIGTRPGSIRISTCSRPRRRCWLRSRHS